MVGGLWAAPGGMGPLVELLRMLLALYIASLSPLWDNKGMHQGLPAFTSILGRTASCPSKAPGLSAEDWFPKAREGAGPGRGVSGPQTCMKKR